MSFVVSSCSNLAPFAPLVTIINTSDCGITNVAINFLNKRVDPDTGKDTWTGVGEKDIFLKTGESVTINVHESALFENISFDCMCENEKTESKNRFEPIKLENRVEYLVEVNYKSSITKIIKKQ
jgi:hypothetical protein